jgi:hypothetical protein
MHEHAAPTTLAIALITMLTLAVSASLTPANARGANVSAPYCRLGAMISVPAGTPCVFRPRIVPVPAFYYPPASIKRSGPGVLWRGYWLYSTEIIEPHDLSRRVVGIRQKIERVGNCHDLEQVQHFVEQSAFITIGPHQPFMNTHGERDSKAG